MNILSNKRVQLSSTGRRFRVSIYVDVFVPETTDLEADRKTAIHFAEKYSEGIPNSYVGEAAVFNGLQLDRDI